MNKSDQREKIQRTTKRRADLGRQNEKGYAMIGLMAVMMFALILTTATAPTLRQETQREKEEEMLWRGQQVAFALQNYRKYRPGIFPTDLNELVQGIDINGKKIRLLRPSALCDPMTPCTNGTNWRLVHPGDPLPKELLDAIIATQEKRQMPLNPSVLQDLARFAQVGATQLPGQADSLLGGASRDGQGASRDGQNDANNSGGLGFEDDKTKKRPIIGVVSKKSDRMFRTYYGIEEYDHALFFPAVPVMVGGFVNPLIMSAVLTGGGGANAPDSRCPNGGLFVDGRCYGNLILGPMKRQEPGGGGGTPQTP
jgi:type II secretory pathway pseudopilin PulG